MAATIYVEYLWPRPRAMVRPMLVATSGPNSLLCTSVRLRGVLTVLRIRLSGDLLGLGAQFLGFSRTWVPTPCTLR